MPKPDLINIAEYTNESDSRGSKNYDYTLDMPVLTDLCVATTGNGKDPDGTSDKKTPDACPSNNIEKDGGTSGDQTARNFKALDIYMDILDGGEAAELAPGPMYLHTTSSKCTPGYVDVSGTGDEANTYGKNLWTDIKTLIDKGYPCHISSDGSATCMRSIYINSTEYGGKGSGLLGSAAYNVNKIDALGIVDNMFAGVAPKCTLVDLKTRDCEKYPNSRCAMERNFNNESWGFVLNCDATKINACYFNDDKNPYRPDLPCSEEDKIKLGLKIDDPSESWVRFQ